MGIRWNRLVEAVLTSAHNLCLEQKYEKYQNFLSENFHLLVVKFSIYLNRHVFVMRLKPVILARNLTINSDSAPNYKHIKLGIPAGSVYLDMRKLTAGYVHNSLSD